MILFFPISMSSQSLSLPKGLNDVQGRLMALSPRGRCFSLYQSFQI